MKIQLKVNDTKTVNELDFYWQEKDYINLLEAFDYPDAKDVKSSEILEYLFMAISDFEPAEAAEIVLNYKMSDKLNEGQIQNLSNEMLVDKVAEEYPDPALHFDIFNINQFLRKAYNGQFPNTEATIINISLEGPDLEKDLTKEVLIKSLSHGLKENNLILRLFEDQINGSVAFTDAAKVIWYYRKLNDDTIDIITSNYWIDKDDFRIIEYEWDIVFHDED